MTPDSKDFISTERPNEYRASFRVRGEITVTIKAESLEDAKEKAAAMCEEDEFGLELDEADDVDVAYVWKTPAMFLVTRDGRTMQVSRLMPGDEPRQPTDGGF